MSAILNPDETADRHERGKVQLRSKGSQGSFTNEVSKHSRPQSLLYLSSQGHLVHFAGKRPYLAAFRSRSFIS